MHSPPHFIALFVAAFLGCCMVAPRAPRLGSRRLEILETKQNRTFHLVSGASVPVEDVSAQEAEKQRVENEKPFKRNSALSVVPRKSANQNSHRSPRRLSDRSAESNARWFLVKEGGSSLTKNQQKVGGYQPADKPSFFRRLFSRKPKSDGFHSIR